MEILGFQKDPIGRMSRRRIGSCAARESAGRDTLNPFMSIPPQSDHTVIADGKTFGIIGAGVMGQTLAKGLLASGVIHRDRLWAGDKNAAACETARQTLQIPVETGFAARIPSADLVLVCVKPGDAGTVMAELAAAGLPKDTLVISILAGVSTER